MYSRYNNVPNNFSCCEEMVKDIVNICQFHWGTVITHLFFFKNYYWFYVYEITIYREKMFDKVEKVFVWHISSEFILMKHVAKTFPILLYIIIYFLLFFQISSDLYLHYLYLDYWSWLCCHHISEGRFNGQNTVITAKMRTVIQMQTVQIKDDSS